MPRPRRPTSSTAPTLRPPTWAPRSAPRRAARSSPRGARGWRRSARWCFCWRVSRWRRRAPRWRLGAARRETPIRVIRKSTERRCARDYAPYVRIARTPRAAFLAILQIATSAFGPAILAGGAASLPLRPAGRRTPARVGLRNVFCRSGPVFAQSIKRT